MKTYWKILILTLIMFPTVMHSQIQHAGIPKSRTKTLKADIIVKKMPSIDVNALLAEDMATANIKDIPFRFGFPHKVNLGISNAGTWDTLDDGSRVWRLKFNSPNAKSINLVFDKFYLPQGSFFFVYNEAATSMLGAYTSENNLPEKNFSTAPLKGEQIILEYNEPANITVTPEINVSYVVHAYRDIFALMEKGIDGYGSSGSCHFNVNCSVGNDWKDQSRSVAMILLDNNSRICSGSLINNARNDGTPYFLTANHCWDASQPTWLFMFKYESSDCNNQDGPTTNTISGSTLIARNSASDFCLVQLSSAPPSSYNPYYSGWNRQDVAATSGAGIHHPSGDIKKISFSNSQFESNSWSGIPSNSHWKVNWSEVDGKTAVTEPGSSGSPIFNQNKQIVGQLHGGPSFCGASSSNLYDLYGKFSMSWDYGTTSSTRLKDWLDPDNSGINTLDGYDPFKFVQIVVDQKLSLNTQVGTIGRWNGSVFPTARLNPGNTITASINGTEVLQGEQTISSCEKYNEWKRNFLSEPNILNHHEFLIRSNDNNFTSQFQPTNPATIQAQLIDGGNSGGSVEFKDPWLIDYPDPNYGNNLRNQGMSAPFKSVAYNPNEPNLGLNTSYKGVFLNQWYDVPNNPYYTVRAQQEQTINGVKGYFVNWSGDQNAVQYQNANNRETPVVFKQSGATATALYKGVHVTNNQSTWNSGNRRYVQTPDGWQHMVYEATINGTSHVIYENKPPGGQWQIVERILKLWLDNGPGNSPAIEYDENHPTFGTPIAIVFKESTRLRLLSYYYDSRQNQYVNGPQYDLAVGETAYSPVVAWGLNGQVMVIWKSSNGLRYWSTQLGNMDAEVFSGNIVGSTSYSNSVTASGTPLGAVDIAWVEYVSYNNQKIEYTYFECMNHSVTQVINTPIVVSTSEMKINSKPAIISFANDCRIAWISDFSGTGDPWQTRAVVCNPLSTPMNYSSYSYYCKSVSLGKRYDDGEWYMAWSSIFDMPQWNDYNWVIKGSQPSAMKCLDTKGWYVQLCNGSDASRIYATVHYPKTAPYSFVQSNSVASTGLSKSGEGVVVTQQREVALEKGGGGLSYRIGKITAGEESVGFVPLTETSQRSGKRMVQNARASADTVQMLFVSKPFVMPEDERCAFQEELSIVDSALGVKFLKENEGCILKVELIDATDGKLLGVLKETRCKTNMDAIGKRSNRLHARGLKGKKVQVRVALEGVKQDVQWSLIDTYLPVIEEENSLQKEEDYEEITLELPALPISYALEQNYPNPFNPTTTIKYDLPEAAKVTMTVYDIVGREVAKLVDGELDAGYHTAVFDGSRYASGIYFVRMTAQGSDAKPYVKTMKIVLIK
jgi:hypothetical protein